MSEEEVRREERGLQRLNWARVKLKSDKSQDSDRLLLGQQNDYQQEASNRKPRFNKDLKRCIVGHWDILPVWR